MKVTNTNAENIVEAVQSIGNQVATAARESGGTSIVPELFKLLEHIEQRMMELNTRLSKLEVLVELLMKKYSEEKTVLFWC
jgi:RNA processing factor Prp31